MPRVILHIEAEAELEIAFDWYWQQSPDAAVNFLDELASVQAQIRRNPQQFPFVTKTLRKAVLQRYPYNLLFRELNGGIQYLPWLMQNADLAIGKSGSNSRIYLFP